MMPPKIGISFSSPFAFIDMITAVSNEMKAKTQFVSAMSTALPASEIPISMISQKNRYFPFCDEVEYESSDAGREQCRRRVEAYEERHEYCGSESHEQELYAYYTFPQRREVVVFHIHIDVKMFMSLQI